MVKLLLDKVADVNVKNNYGKTALIAAAGGGHTDIVKFLLSKVADVNVKNEYGNTALMAAAEGGHTNIIELLKKYGAK
jgi:ankyrin repeat protein